MNKIEIEDEIMLELARISASLDMTIAQVVRMLVVQELHNMSLEEDE